MNFEERLLFAQGRAPGQKPDIPAWSWSALSSAQGCPRQHQAVRVLRSYADQPSPQSTRGQMVHEALARTLQNGDGLPDELRWLSGFCADLRKRGGLRVEHRAGYDFQLRPTGFFSRNVWVRTVFDVLIPDLNTALIIDWKTGRRKHGVDQLNLMASLLLLSDDPPKKVLTTFVWLDHRDMTEQVVTLEDAVDFMCDLRMDRLNVFKQFDRNRSWMEYDANPSWRCRFCPVIECLHNARENT